MTSLPKSLDPKTLATLEGLQVRSRQIVEGLLAGTHRSPFRGVSVEFAEHREYVQGDDLRHVDWNVYARTDKLYLKQFVDETNLHCVLLVDSSASMQFATEQSLSKYEYAQCLAAALGWLVLRNGDAVGAAVSELPLKQWLPSASHSEQFQRLIDLLTKVEIQTQSPSKSFSDFLTQGAVQLSQKSIVFILSDFFMDSEALTRGVERLKVKGHDVTLFHVLDRGELKFPFQGDVELNSLEGQQTVQVDADLIGGRYQELIEQFCQNLEATVRNLGADYELLASDVNLQMALLTYFQRSASRRSV